MTFTQGKFSFLSKGSRFSFRAILINARRRKELIKKGIDKKTVNSAKCLNSLFFVLSKREYKELKFGGTKVLRLIALN